MSHARWARPAVALAFVAPLVLIAACAPESRTSRAVATGEADPHAAWLNMQPAVAYVGQDACRPCHRDIDATYRRTGMGRAFSPLTADNLVEHWTEKNEVVDQASGVRYRMERREGKFWQRQYVLDAAGRETMAEEHELVWVVGSNNHSRSYISVVDGKWFQPPVCWYPQGDRWDLCPGYELSNMHFSREITESCLFCHNGVMVPVEGVRNAFREPIPHGIGCERCHGPGQLHVERWSSGEAPTGEVDHTIVNPRHLEPQHRIQVCFQCHLGDSKASERVARYGRESSSFRPGQPIGEIKVSFRYSEQLASEFSLSSQADRLMLSRCFEASAGRIECLTCHDPHVSVYSPERPIDAFRQACLGCHDVAHCTAPAEARRATTKLADDCVACHMRRDEPDDQRFTEFTDHWIRREIEVDESEERRSHELEPMDPALLASFPPGEQAFYMARAYHLMAAKFPHPEREPYHREALAAYLRAVASGFDVAESWYYLGKIHEELRDGRAALDAFTRAVERDATYFDARFALAQTSAALGDAARARRIYEAMLAERPDDPMLLSEAGRLWFAAGERPRALAAIERAVRLEPWNAKLHLNRGMVLAADRRLEEAARSIEEAVRRDPDNPRLWDVYAKVMGELGRPAGVAEARYQLAQLEAASRANPFAGRYAGPLMGGGTGSSP